MSQLFNKVKQKFSGKSAGDMHTDDNTSSSSSSSGGMLGSKRAKKWHVNKTYNVGDQVRYKNVTYQCLVSHTSMKGIPPSVDTTDWMVATDTPVSPTPTPTPTPTPMPDTPTGGGVTPSTPVV